MNGFESLPLAVISIGGQPSMDQAVQGASAQPAQTSEMVGQAQAPQGPAVSPCGGQSMMSFVMIGVIFVVFYFLLIRPQQKRQKEHQSLLSALQKGDTVYTQGGIYGKVTNLTDNTVTLDVSADPGKEVRMKVLRHAIAGKSTPQSEGGAAKDSEAIQQSQRK